MRAYKDSGIEWLGEIPEHWEVVKIKHIAEIITGKTPTLDSEWGDNMFFITPTDCDLDKKYVSSSLRKLSQNGIKNFDSLVIPKNSILVTCIASIGKVAINLEEVITNQQINSVIPNADLVLPDFIFYQLLATMPFAERYFCGYSILPILNKSEFSNIKIPLPPLEEQKAIAKFLDSKCKQIESFVDKKQRLIALLNEKKQALINECVTKGLSAICHCKALTRHSKDSPSCHSEDLAEESHPACHSERSEESKNIETQDTESRCFAIAQHDRIEYKDSGIEHLGKIPSHWEVRRLATFGKFSKGGNISRQDLVENGEQALLYGDIYMNYEISTSFLDSKISENTSLGATPIYRGDILFAGSGETKEDIGKNIVYLGNDRAFVGGDVIIFRQKENNALFLSYALNTKYAKFYKGIESKGEIIVHIYASNLKDIKIPLPPIEEQKQIAQFLDSEISKIDSIIGKIKKQIELIKEYKNSLINQAVCGKVGVQKGKR